jgi:hypothetical protein
MKCVQKIVVLSAILGHFAFDEAKAAIQPPNNRLASDALKLLMAKVAWAIHCADAKEDLYVHLHTILDEVDWLACVERPYLSVSDEMLAYAHEIDLENPEPEWFTAESPEARMKKRCRRRRFEQEPRVPIETDWEIWEEWEDEEPTPDWTDENLADIDEWLSALTAEWYAEQARIEMDSLRHWAEVELEAEGASAEEEVEIDDAETDALWGAIALTEDVLEELWSLWGDAGHSPEGIYIFSSAEDDKDSPPANPGFGGYVPR